MKKELVTVYITNFNYSDYIKKSIKSDIDKDGLKDIIISPNGVNISENVKNCLYYKNLGQNDENILQFQFTQNDLFTNEMIDVGSNSIPILHDLNNDGLLDLVIGNKGYYNEANYDSRLSCYKNIGTATNPKFSPFSTNKTVIF